MDLQGIDEPKSAREQVAEFVGLLVREYGSQQKLVQAIVKHDPELRGLTREAVSAWVNGRSLPRESAARALGDLLEEEGEAFIRLWSDAQEERPLESAELRHDVAPRSMSVLGIVWLGAVTEDLESSCKFFEDVMRLHFVHRCEKDHAIYRCDNGDYVALYGPLSDRKSLFTTGPVAGFRVNNIAAARAEMEAKGVTFLGPIMATDGNRWKYLHYLGPDGRVYELVEESPWADEHGDLAFGIHAD
jgi:predicted enzyme related to lactoylglutathione lyase